jgi:hypothetical protein
MVGMGAELYDKFDIVKNSNSYSSEVLSINFEIDKSAPPKTE